MNALANYARWLQLLMALGDKLPKILAALQALFDAIGDAFPAATPVGGGGLGLYATPFPAMALMDEPAVPQEILDAEAKVLAIAAPAGAFSLGDGSRLRKLFDWIQSSGLGEGLFNTLIAAVLKKFAGV